MRGAPIPETAAGAGIGTDDGETGSSIALR